MPASTKSPERKDTWLALGICVALALLWTLPLSDAQAWGWDESMHAELPAARMLVALQQGDFGRAHEALLDCQQYPFVWPLGLALVQLVTGISEHACRVAGTLAWCWTLFGLFLLGRELGDRITPPLFGRRWLPWALLALAALSPLCLAYAGTLFLEVPFACASVWALRAWIRRDGTATRELAAGEWITLALFTKWNYGLLLGAGLALAWLCEAWDARRELRKYVGRTIALVVVPLLACLWWFVLARGAEHRAALLAFLHGNANLGRVGYETRWLHTVLFLHQGLVCCVLVLALALAALTHRTPWRAKQPQVRVFLCVALALVFPSWSHPFHLDRFLIPQAIPVWTLAAIGFARLWPKLRLVAVALFAIGLLGLERQWFLGTLHLASKDEATLAYQHGLLHSWRDLSGSRALPTSGLERSAHDALLDAIAKEAGPKERVGWIGMSNGFSPAALHLGLLARGGSPERFLAECTRPLDVTYEGRDPNWTDEQLATWAKGFDLVLHTLPPDLKDLEPRRFERQYALRLVALGWQEHEIARTLIARALKPPIELMLYACRPNK